MLSTLVEYYLYMIIYHLIHMLQDLLIHLIFLPITNLLCVIIYSRRENNIDRAKSGDTSPRKEVDQRVCL